MSHTASITVQVTLTLILYLIFLRGIRSDLNREYHPTEEGINLISIEDYRSDLELDSGEYDPELILLIRLFKEVPDETPTQTRA